VFLIDKHANFVEMDKNRDFPQYRKLSNGMRYYKIIGDRVFEEKQIMGSRISSFTFEAKQYPEILLIQDMLEGNEVYLDSNEAEWEQLKSSH
jgi:hypothetical protein